MTTPEYLPTAHLSPSQNESAIASDCVPMLGKSSQGYRFMQYCSPMLTVEPRMRSLTALPYSDCPQKNIIVNSKPSPVIMLIPKPLKPFSLSQPQSQKLS